MIAPLHVVLLGPPGAGKGTLAAQLKQRLGLAHISTGDMLRSAIAAGTQVGLLAKGYLDRGDLVPDDVVITIVEHRLHESDCEKGFLLDGFPRTVPQARALDGITRLTAVLLVDVEAERLIRRIAARRTCPNCGQIGVASTDARDLCPACGATMAQRADDREETVRNRLAVYNRQTEPLVGYYRDQGILHTVDGAQDIESVYVDALALLESLL